MLQVPIHTFKAHLSHYLKCAEQGESVVVTSYRKPIVQLLCANKDNQKHLELVQRLRAIPGVYWDGEKPAPQSFKIKRGGKTMAALILSDRR